MKKLLLEEAPYRRSVIIKYLILCSFPRKITHAKTLYPKLRYFILNLDAQHLVSDSERRSPRIDPLFSVYIDTYKHARARTQSHSILQFRKCIQQYIQSFLNATTHLHLSRPQVPFSTIRAPPPHPTPSRQLQPFLSATRHIHTTTAAMQFTRFAKLYSNNIPMIITLHFQYPSNSINHALIYKSNSTQMLKFSIIPNQPYLPVINIWQVSLSTFWKLLPISLYTLINSLDE